MSYTEGSEQEMGLIPSAVDLYRKSLSEKLQEQLNFSEERLIQATNQGAIDEQYKWSGYIQALRFIKSKI